MAKDLTIRKEVLLEAPVRVVWQALTDSKMVRQYMFDCDVESEWTKGSAIRFRDEKRVQAEGVISDIEKEKRLVYTMYDPERYAETETRNHLLVQITLKPQGNSTKMMVKQGDYRKLDNSEERFNDAEAGWIHVIDQLRQLMRDNVTI